MRITDNKLELFENGIYIKNTTENYRLITVSNKRLTGDDSTKVIFKFGYNLDENFIKRTKAFKDFTAQIIEHEIDHLFGIII